MERFPVHACTDVTGFGLLGHTLEMAEGSGVGIRIKSSDVPILPGTRELAGQGIIPGGSKSNFCWVADRVSFPDEMSELNRCHILSLDKNIRLIKIILAYFYTDAVFYFVS